MSQDDLLGKLHSALESSDEKWLQEVLANCDLETLQECVLADPTIFVHICARGYVTAAHHLQINCSVNLTAAVEGRTALQWACLRGHTEIVKLLLPLHVDLNLKAPAWQENSEFYSATIGGHTDIVEMLIESFPVVLKAADVLQSLVYAACMGGHLLMVKRWLLPSLDVNQPVQLVTSLHDCEHRTPLHAACQGSHAEVAKLLVEHCGAEITEHLAQKFPDFTAALLDDVYHSLRIRDADMQVEYNLSRCRVHTIHPVWIRPHLSDITHINLSNNMLRHLDLCVPWTLRNLLHLDISHNQIGRLLAPDKAEDIICHRLEVVNASHNCLSEICLDLFQLQCLTHLNLSHNALQRLEQSQSRHSLTESLSTPSWRLPNLATLNLSHNQLDLLTPDLKYCPALTRLDASHNNLSTLPSPWDCQLEYLDVSNNQLERFPSSTEQFWSGSLTYLFLNNNNLDQIDENILKLGVLVKLNVSHNKIQSLAPSHIWDCPSLVELNLSHNCLGKAQKAAKKKGATAVEFPSELLSEELRVLNLSDNMLIHFPVSVCYIKNLATLDVSNNPMSDLPKELGNLRECWELKLQGLKLQKPDLQEVVKTGRPTDVIEHLQKQLRKVQPCNIVKVLVIGPKDKGKSTVIESLVRGNVNEVKLSDQHVTVTTYVLKSHTSMKIRDRADSDRPDITLRIWELAGNPELLALQPLMWTENSLFLLVWDMTDETSGLFQWLCNIKSRLSRVGIIIVATFQDRIPSAEVGKKVHQLHADINRLYGEMDENVGKYPKEDIQKIMPQLCGVVFMTRHMHKKDILDLKRMLYTSALKMVKVVYPAKFVVGQLMPKSYLVMDKKLTKMAEQFKDGRRPPYLTQEEFDGLLRSEPLADFDTFDDRHLALETWNQLGSLLHYDVWAEGLGRLYFLDPNWLASMVAAVLKPPGPGMSAQYRQSVQEVILHLSNLEFPSNIMGPFLQLLRHFDIGAVHDNSLLLPCLLPTTAPGLQLSRTKNSRVLLRFYAMPHVPSRLWSRLILGLLLSMDRFSQSYWHGLKIEKPQMMYWQTGLNMRYSGGSIVIESAIFKSLENSHSKYPGILISILTESPTLGDLAVIGFVTDEIDLALKNVFPHYNDNTELFGIYALCPICFSVRPCEGLIQGKRLHFPLADCAGYLLNGNFAHCLQGNKVPLEELVPEFLMGELPQKFHLHHQDLELKEKLGKGAVGTVHKGFLRGEVVAVKVFYRNRSEDLASPDSGMSTMSSTDSHSSFISSPPSATSLEPSVYGNFQQVSEQLQLRRQDSMDCRNLKVCRAFSELRQEIVILSQLRHPCLVSLLGVSVRPSLLVVLELAPLGSLRGVLDGYMKDRPFNKYHFQDRDKTFSTVLNRDITFKIVYQVGAGLEYLHVHNILYRDLKSDNILVCSMELGDKVNVKISDYGISKFTTAEGMVGMVGTPGYMAPEIMDGQAYNEKVDIFSYSMVIYEVLTGHPPFEKCGRLHQIHYFINTEKRRPSLKEYNVVPNFPYLETLMEDMWEHDPRQRPSATDVLHRMEDVGFLLQHSHMAMAANMQAGSRQGDSLFWNVTCIWALKETNRAVSITGRNNVWVWESPSGDRQDRRLSIHNLASGRLQAPICKSCPGDPVTCMAKVGPNMWVGVQGGTLEVYDINKLAKLERLNTRIWGRLCADICDENDGQGGSLEIYSSSYTDLSKGKYRMDDLEASPVAIIHDKNSPRKEQSYAEGEGFVYIGLSDGTIQVFQHYRKCRRVFTKEWRLYKTLTITTHSTLHAMCLLPSQKELVVGCGHSLVIISTSTLLVEKRVCIPKDLPPSVRNKVGSVQTLERNEDTLWCSFKNSPLIMELETSTWKVSGAYYVEADLEVFITEVKLGVVLGEVGVCKVCGGVSSFVLSPQRPAGSQSEAEKGRDKGDKMEESLPAPPPLPPRSLKPKSECFTSDHQPPRGVSIYLNRDEIRDESAQVQMRRELLPACPQGGNSDGNPCGTNTVGDVDQAKLEELRKSLAWGDTTIGTVLNRSRRSISSSERPSHSEDVFLSSAEEPPPRRTLSACPARPADAQAGAARLDKVKSLTMPNLSTRRRAPPPPPPPPPIPVRRRSLPSEHDGVHVQSLLSVKDTLWVGSSCGEILVIGVRKRKASSSVPSPPFGADTARMSLNLEWKQMCNLKSVRMTADSKVTDQQLKKKSGGVHKLVQARNLVVAVRNVTQEEKARGVAEIAVWQACPAERISTVRQHWRSLQALTTSMDN